MSDDKFTACRCFRYIASMTEDEKIKELCSTGEMHAKKMAEKLEQYRKELGIDRRSNASSIR